MGEGTGFKVPAINAGPASPVIAGQDSFALSADVCYRSLVAALGA
jgi:hypothetical protein